MNKLLFVFGTRPEAIKIAPIIRYVKNNPNFFEYKVCVTAQHRLMLDQVLQLFEIVPDFDLDIMKKNQNLFTVTTSILDKIQYVLEEYSPSVVIVHGDTTTTMSTSLAAFYKQIPVAHVEAGLRTFNKYSPYPEEMNRQLTTKLSSYHFAPTKLNKQHLLNEGIKEQDIIVCGNSVIDALIFTKNKINNDANKKNQLDKLLLPYKINTNRKYILVTGHRRENFGDDFINICKAIKEIAIKYSNIDIVYPVHLNPNVQEPVYKYLKDIDNIYLLDPLDYEPFVYLLDNSYIILTDSGGIQEEAPSIGKPVLLMRNNTERQEAVDAGTVKLVGCDRIVENVKELLENKEEYNKMSISKNPYGDGSTSKLIIEALFKKLN